MGKVTRNCAVKKSLCGTERFSKLSGESDADDDCGFSVAEAAEAADLAGVSNVDCSERCTALTARGDDASEELVITPKKARISYCDTGSFKHHQVTLCMLDHKHQLTFDLNSQLLRGGDRHRVPGPSTGSGLRRDG